MVHLIKPNGHKKNTAADLERSESSEEHLLSLFVLSVVTFMLPSWQLDTFCIKENIELNYRCMPRLKRERNEKM